MIEFDSNLQDALDMIGRELSGTVSEDVVTVPTRIACHNAIAEAIRESGRDDRAGLRESKRRRSTGTVVSIYNSVEAGMDDGDGECKYSIVCEDHNFIIGVPTLKLARYHAPFFDCEVCTGVAEPGDFAY